MRPCSHHREKTCPVPTVSLRAELASIETERSRQGWWHWVLSPYSDRSPCTLTSRLPSLWEQPRHMDPGHVVPGGSQGTTHWQSQPLWNLSPYTPCLGFFWNKEVLLVGFARDRTQSLLHKRQIPSTEPPLRRWHLCKALEGLKEVQHEWSYDAKVLRQSCRWTDRGRYKDGMLTWALRDLDPVGLVF